MNTFQRARIAPSTVFCVRRQNRLRGGQGNISASDDSEKMFRAVCVHERVRPGENNIHAACLRVQPDRSGELTAFHHERLIASRWRNSGSPLDERGFAVLSERRGNFHFGKSSAGSRVQNRMTIHQIRKTPFTSGEMTKFSSSTI